MYKIKKQAKRTPKQLFALLKDRLLEMARSQPRAKVTQLSNQRVIFPEPLKFPAAAPEEFADQAVTAEDLKDHPTVNYEFYLQNYGIKINDELLSLLRPHCIYSIPERPKYGRPNVIASNIKGVVAVGSSTGALVIVNDMEHKVFEKAAVSSHPIISVDIS